MTDDLTEAQQIDLNERIAIRVIDGEQSEEVALEKGFEELKVWWEDVAT
jgi:hypothetical protein